VSPEKNGFQATSVAGSAHSVRILSFKLSCVSVDFDLSAETVIKDLNLSPEEVAAVGSAVVDIEIQGVKPKQNICIPTIPPNSWSQFSVETI
jgi:hypothetical protein